MQRRERKVFGALPIDTFFVEDEEEKKEEAPDKEMAETSFADVTHTLRQSKRNKTQTPHMWSSFFTFKWLFVTKLLVNLSYDL